MMTLWRRWENSKCLPTPIRKLLSFSKIKCTSLGPRWINWNKSTDSLSEIMTVLQNMLIKMQLRTRKLSMINNHMKLLLNHSQMPRMTQRRSFWQPREIWRRLNRKTKSQVSRSPIRPRKLKLWRRILPSYKRDLKVKWLKQLRPIKPCMKRRTRWCLKSENSKMNCTNQKQAEINCKTSSSWFRTQSRRLVHSKSSYSKETKLFSSYAQIMVTYKVKHTKQVVKLQLYR